MTINLPVYCLLFYQISGETYANKSLESVLNGINLPPMMIHQIRHTHCTLLLEASASMKEV